MVSEILLVDEVLAVGDAAFQKKCIGRMNEVAHEGRTVLFVSHNMAAVRALCTRGICLEQGRVSFAGDIERVLYRYTQSQIHKDSQPNGTQTRFTSIRVNGQNPGNIESGEGFEVGCTLELAEEVPSFRLFCIIQDANGESVVVVPSNSRVLNTANQAGVHQICVRFPGLWLRPGVYSVYFKLLAVASGSGDARYLSDSMMLDVTGTDDPEMLLGISGTERKLGNRGFGSPVRGRRSGRFRRLNRETYKLHSARSVPGSPDVSVTFSEAPCS